MRFGDGEFVKALTEYIDFGRYFSQAVTILSHASVLAALVPGNAVVEEEDVVGGNDLVGELPEVVGLRVGLGRAKDLSTGRALLNSDQLVGNLDVLRWVFKVGTKQGCWDAFE